MRIVEIIPQLSSGGGERFTVDLCNELAKRNEVKLIVLHSLAKVGFYARELSPAVKVVSMDKRSGADLLLPLRLYREVLRFRPDVVQTHLRGIIYAFLLILLRRRIMHCHTVHNAADKEAGFFVSRSMRKFFFKNGLSVPVTISEESRRSFVDFYGMDAPMIFNGRNVPSDLQPSAEVKAEFAAYRRTPHTRVLVNLARIMAVKRQSLIARACRRLYDEGYDFTMLFIGRAADKEMVNEIEAAACPGAHMLGEKNNPLEYMKSADAYCLMSSYEGMPISLIEALGVGAVPVCTPVGGIVDVVRDGENGILASDLSEEACYMALKRFLELSDEELAAMKDKALAAYAPFSMTECARKYEALFRGELPRGAAR